MSGVRISLPRPFNLLIGREFIFYGSIWAQFGPTITSLLSERIEQGLRILHRSTVRGVQNLMPDFGLPMQLNIFGPSPLGDGVWQAGGLGFRWDDALPMQN